jgi:hypothetical protein
MLRRLEQCTPDFPCADYPLCGLSMHDCKLLMTNDKGEK